MPKKGAAAKPRAKKEEPKEEWQEDWDENQPEWKKMLGAWPEEEEEEDEALKWQYPNPPAIPGAEWLKQRVRAKEEAAAEKVHAQRWKEKHGKESMSVHPDASSSRKKGRTWYAESAGGICYNCGRDGASIEKHKDEPCPKTGGPCVLEDKKEKKDRENQEKEEAQKKKLCFNCNEYGHAAAACPKGKMCNCCGSADHLEKECPRKKEKCEKCGKVGHIEARCHSNVGKGKEKGATGKKRRLCTFFQQGRCTHGKKCWNTHEEEDDKGSQSSNRKGKNPENDWIKENEDRLREIEWEEDEEIAEALKEATKRIKKAKENANKKRGPPFQEDESFRVRVTDVSDASEESGKEEKPKKKRNKGQPKKKLTGNQRTAKALYEMGEEGEMRKVNSEDDDELFKDREKAEDPPSPCYLRPRSQSEEEKEESSVKSPSDDDSTEKGDWRK